jgi:hypothetical protein
VAIAAAAAITCVSYLAGGAIGIGTSARDPVFNESHPAWSQALLPASDVPLLAPPSASTLAARGSLAIALGRRTALRDLAAVSGALAIAAFAVWLRAGGIAVLPAILAALAMSAGITFWSRGVAWSPDALAPALAILSAWAFWRWLESDGRLHAAIAVAAAMLAIAEDPSWLAVLPGAAALAWSRVTAPRSRRAALLAIVSTSIACFVFLWSRAAVAQRVPWLTIATEPAPDPIASWRHSTMATSGMTAGMLQAPLQEFTLLGAALVIIGVVVLWVTTSHRLPLLLVVGGLAAWHLVGPRPPFEPVSVPLAVCGWAAAAVALAWLPSVAVPNAGLPLVTVVSLIAIGQPSLTRIRLSALGHDAASETRARMAYDFKISDLPEPTAAIVAESRRVDAAIMLSSTQMGSPAVIVPQSRDAVLAVMRSGRPVAAFPTARAQLERMGFLFERAWAATAPVFIAAGHTPCLTVEDGRWTDVSAIVAADSFVIDGGSLDTAPAGVVLRVSGPVKLDRIEPRSIWYELTDTKAGEEGIAELKAFAPIIDANVIQTFRVPYTGRRSPVMVRFEKPPVAAAATGDDPTPVRLCAGPARFDLMLGRSATAMASISMAASIPFGPGWHSPEADPDIFRWTAAPAAAVRVTMEPPGPARVTVTASPVAPPAQQPSIALTVNACRLPSRPMPPGQGDYEWDVAPSCWRSGANQMWIHTGPLMSPASLGAGHDTRQLGARIGAIRLARAEQ